jgi:hypothetical protein
VPRCADGAWSSKLSVFERLHQRGMLKVERLRNRRLLLERERRRNMERCLMAVCLLVKVRIRRAALTQQPCPTAWWQPQPRVVPVNTFTLTLGDEARKYGCGPLPRYTEPHTELTPRATGPPARRTRRQRRC